MVIVHGAEWHKDSHKLIYHRKYDELIANITSRLYIWLKKPHDWSLAIIPHKQIGLRYDGESFNDETAADCADRLELLRTIGYRVPQSAIDALRDEMED